jgi:hypothetical protein
MRLPPNAESLDASGRAVTLRAGVTAALPAAVSEVDAAAGPDALGPPAPAARASGTLVDVTGVPPP